MFVFVLGRDPTDRKRVHNLLGHREAAPQWGPGDPRRATIVIEAAEPGRSTPQADEPGVAEPDANTDRVIQGWQHARH